MNYLSVNNLPTLALILIVLAHLGAGIVIGMLYFRSLWSNVRQLAGGGRVTTMIALIVGRLALLSVVLVLASLEGTGALLATVLGVVIGRAVIMRKVRQITP